MRRKTYKKDAQSMIEAANLIIHTKEERKKLHKILRRLESAGISTSSDHLMTLAAIVDHRSVVEGYIKRCESANTYCAKRFSARRDGKETALKLEASHLRALGIECTDAKRLKKMLGEIDQHKREVNRRKNHHTELSASRLNADRQLKKVLSEMRALADEAIEKGYTEPQEIEAYVDRQFVACGE